MKENTKALSEEVEKLTKENKELQQKLRVAMEFLEAVKNGNIDAVIIPGEKQIKVFTEKTSDKTYRILIEKMHEGAVTLNREGTILYCNSSFASMVSLPLQKAIGAKFENFIDDSSKEEVEALIKEDREKAIKKEVNIYAEDGTVIPVLMTANTLTIDNSFALSIILTDLTIQKKNQQELKRRAVQLEQNYDNLENLNEELVFQIKEKERKAAELVIANTDVKELAELNSHKETTLAILSHDLRSPLSGIIGAAEYLKSYFHKMKQEEIKEMLTLLHIAAKDQLDMLDYLVEWARVKYASETFLPEKILLTLYVKKVFDTLNENAVANKITLQNEIKENTNVFADGKMMLSVLQNLISNAIKHTGPGGRINVTATGKEDKVIVQVKDTGIGMSKAITEKLFTPQMKSLSQERKENKGAGIGLLLARSFVEKNGGEIWVESVEGEGSSFYFTLPVNKT